MFSLLFHTDVFMPTEAKNTAVILNQAMTGYFLSRHFEEHLNNQESEDRSHTYFAYAVLNSLNDMCSKYKKTLWPFEVEYSKDFHFFGRPGWFVTKYCVRVPYSLTDDLVIVIRPQWNKISNTYDFDRNKIVTAWLNHKKDDHKTLDASKYCTEEKWLSCK